MAGDKPYAYDTELTVLIWNVRSITGFCPIKMAELEPYIKKKIYTSPIQVICIQETHYKHKSKPFKLDGYQKPIIKIG